MEVADRQAGAPADPFDRFVCLIVGLGLETNLFEFSLFLVLARLALFLCLLVAELAIIENTADRRDGIRRDLYQIQTPLLGDLQGCLRSQNSKLLVLIVDNTNFASANSVVYPYVFVDVVNLQTYPRGKR